MFQEILNKSLKLNSQRVAIERGRETLSYERLSTLSDKITGALLKENTGPGTLVGIQLTNKTELISAIIGVLNARCVFVPLNPALPAKRLASMMEDLNLSCLITSKKEDASPGHESSRDIRHFYYKDMTGRHDATEIIKASYPHSHGDDSLYVYFTSGTTGRPKGIVGKNKSLLQFLQWEIAEFGIDHTCRVSQLISPYFDAFLRDIFVPLLAGGTICIPPDDEDALSPEKLTSWIDEMRINLIHCVPSVFRVINNSSNLSSEKLTHLKFILLSGEKILPQELLNWYKLFNDRIGLVNFYGTTETTMIRSFYRIRPEDVNLAKIPIGSPIGDTELLIAQNNFDPCSEYMSGDLYIISDYTTWGYLNQPEVTHEKFIKYRNTIAYNTGDKARKLANGLIDLIGREDRQIKLRGIRIEPEEIENLILQSKLLQQALILCHTTDAGESLLAAFVIRAKGADPAFNIQEALDEYLRANLPEYMIPSTIIELHEYPFLSNGKIDYAALANMLTRNEIVKPKNKIEEHLLQIWKEILGDHPISTEDNFHQIGGSSLSLIRLIAKIYRKFNVRISLKELFNNLTIRKQAEYISKATKDIVLAISKAIEKPAYRLSSAQERIYYNYTLDQYSTAFNLPMAWEIEGMADIPAIENAFRLLIERHESLRTEFIVEPAGILQVVKESIDFTIQHINISETIANEEEIVKHVIKPFDLHHAPLIRCLIATLKDNKRLLIIDVHHIICDGISQINLLSDFVKIYKGEKLKPLAIQYKDYAEWEYNYKGCDEYMAHREFWLKAFEGNIPALELPIEVQGIQEMSGKGANMTFTINQSILGPIIDELKEREIPAFSVLLSIYFIYLYRFSGQNDIVVGTNSSGRMQDEVEDVVGMFAKTLPIRYSINSNSTFREFVMDLHAYFVEANCRQVYDLIDMVTELNRTRPVPVDNLFNTMFVFQNFEKNVMPVRDIKFSNYLFQNTTAKYPISLFVHEESDLYIFRFEYSFAWFTREDIELLSMEFQSLVHNILANMDAKIIQYIEKDVQSDEYMEDDIAFRF